MNNRRTFKYILEQNEESIKIIKYQNGYRTHEKAIPSKIYSQRNIFDEKAIKAHILTLKKTFGTHTTFHSEKVDRLIGNTDPCENVRSIIENEPQNNLIHNVNSRKKNLNLSQPISQDQNTNDESKKQNVLLPNPDSQNFLENQFDNNMEIVFDTVENDKIPFPKKFSINDEIARNWLNLIHKREYSPIEFQYLKLNNEINDMERYLNNRAPECTQKVVVEEYIKINSTFIEYTDWYMSDHEKFVEYFSTFNKNFNIIAKLLNKNIEDVVLHYYRTKKIEKYHHKKNGRISDSNLEILIELEWNENERNKFTKLFEFYGKNWHNYPKNFFGKNINDFKNLYRYLNKKNTLLESDETKDKIKNGEAIKMENLQESTSITTNCSENVYLPQHETFSTLLNCEKISSAEKNPEASKNPAKEIVKPEKSSFDKHPGVVRKPKKTRKKKTSPVKRPKKSIFKKQIVSQRRYSEDKENIVNKKDDFNIVNEWSIDERQLFAIFYPFIGKKWYDLSQYITTKKPIDCRNYFKYYFKTISPQEQKLEAAMKNIERKTFSVPSTPKRNYDDDFLENVGYIFKK